MRVVLSWMSWVLPLLIAFAFIWPIAYELFEDLDFDSVEYLIDSLEIYEDDVLSLIIGSAFLGITVVAFILFLRSGNFDRSRSFMSWAAPLWLGVVLAYGCYEYYSDDYDGDFDDVTYFPAFLGAGIVLALYSFGVLLERTGLTYSKPEKRRY